MTMNDILETIYGLSLSQGFYGRLYESLMELKEDSPEDYEELSETWEGMDFKDSLDFILYLES